MVLKDKWQLEALLGVGGTAAIYAAKHRNGKRAAIKILHPELTSNDEVVQRFLREGYAANKLEHAGAVSVLDDDRTDDGAVFLVMELLEGTALDRYARQTGERLPLDRVLRIGDELLDVLAAAHAKGVIHRDIKPANLFLTRDGRLKVLDFGIARLREGLATDSSATQTGTSIGTPAFMPPEQARGRWSEVDARTDVWAAGAALFALLCGQRPRKAETVNEELLLAMTQPVPSLAQVAPDVPRPVVDVIDRALAFDREQRWSDARAMQVALKRAGDVALASRSMSSSSASSPLAMTFSPDTAPVMGGAVPTPTPMPHPPPMPLEPLDARLTTSRPLVAGGASPKERQLGLAIGVFGVTLVIGLVAFGAIWMRQHAAKPTEAPITVDTKLDAPKPTATAVNAPLAVTATATTSAVGNATTATTATSAPAVAVTALPTALPTHAPTSAKPAASHAKPATNDDEAMMNQRF